MSRRLATGECPTKQILLFQTDRPEIAEDQRGRHKNSTQPRDTWEHAVGCQGGNECGTQETSHWRLNKANHSYDYLEHTDFKKNIMTNVFIDSYYPRLRSNNSDEYDNSEKSFSSFPDINSILNSEGLSELDSKTQIKKNIISRGESKKCKQEPHTDEKTGSSEGAPPIVESSRSKITLDSKTYTLNSRCSAAELPSIKNVKRANVFAQRIPVGVAEEEQQTTKGGLNDILKIDASESAVDSYDRLQKRIEILEDLLQQTLGVYLLEQSPKQTDRSKYTKKAKPPKLPNKSKTKFAMPKNCTQNSFPETPNPPISTDSDLRKEKSETDNEFTNVKKRVKALEMMLKQSKEKYSSNRSSESSGESTREKDEQDFGEPCVRTFEVCSCLLKKNRSKTPEKETTDRKKSRKVRRKFLKKCRKICSGLTYSKERESSQTDTEINDVHQFLLHHSKEFDDKTFHITPTAEEERKNHKLTCQENAAESSKKHRKRRRKTQKKLPRTISRMNLAMMENSARNFASGEGEATIFDSDGEFLKHYVSKEVWAETSSYEGLVHPPRWGPCSREPRCWKDVEYKSAKDLKKIGSFRNPIEILKQGGRIKIPVLFQEVGNSKSKKPSQKISNVSMRFVIVQQDNKRPLKKLMDKLTRGNSSHRKEQYIFGVSELCCGNEKLAPLWRKEFLKGLLYS